ncbi:hypothetical protein P8452_19390 [Trifolium repens]|nr:hypothetical protein P8452_19390 [Trifolium repens]
MSFPHIENQLGRFKFNNIHLSPCVFSCRTLQVLNLSCLRLKDITFQPLNLPLLKTLRWNCVVFKNINHVIQLLSSCPIIEELHANHSFFQQRKIPVENNLMPLPNLAKASLSDFCFPITMLTLLSRVKNLQLQTNGIICYTELPIFYNLTSIELIYSKVRPVPEFSKLVWWLQLLKHCPKLQNVTIQDYDVGDESDILDKYLKDNPIVPPCLSSQLKTFRLTEELHAKYSLFQDYTIPVENNLKPLPNLVKASMCGSWFQTPMLTLMSRAKNLHLQTNGIGYTDLSIFYNLTSIELIYNITIVPKISKLVWWLQLLKQCPKLQNVTIQDYDVGDESDILDKYLKDNPIVPPCFSSQLKTFRLTKTSSNF